jgi:hypothetical protein
MAHEQRPRTPKAGSKQVVNLPLPLRNRLKDDVEVILKDYLRDNLDNWKTQPTPGQIDEYLRFHMPGYTREAVVILFERYLTELIGLVATGPEAKND